MVGRGRGVGFFVGVVHCRGVKAGFVDFDSRLEMWLVNWTFLWPVMAVCRDKIDHGMVILYPIIKPQTAERGSGSIRRPYQGIRI